MISTVLKLAKWWAFALVAATLFRWAIVYDKLHPAPSQAAVDQVYRDNNDYRAIEASMLVQTAAAIEEICGAPPPKK